MIGKIGGTPVARIASLYREGLYEQVPTPPPHLMKRVANTEAAPHFNRIWSLCAVPTGIYPLT